MTNDQHRKRFSRSASGAYAILAAIFFLVINIFAKENVMSKNSEIRFETDKKRANSQCALLNGWWEFAPIYEEAAMHSLPSDYPEKILVPSFWNTLPPYFTGDWGAYKNFEWPEKWNEARAAAYKRKFDLPPRPKGMILYLRFDAVLAQTEVFVNEAPVLEIEDGFLPHETDITGKVKWGEKNTIELLVREQPTRNGQFMRPAGSWVGWHLRGIWQDCSLRLEPAVRIADVWIQPSVRRHILKVWTSIENASSEDAVVWFSHKVEGESIRMESREEKIPARSSITRALEQSWISPILWSPETPHLYFLESALYFKGDAKNPLDQVRTRFGFKEFRIEGTQFFLNGLPIRFKGDSWHYVGAAEQTPEYAREWFKMVKQIGANCVRLHAMPYPPFFLDLADEMGICIINECAVYGSGGNLALKEDEFWDYARAHVKRFVQRDRNHPSVCLWSACNEIVWKGGAESFPKILSLEQAIGEEDPTRPVSFDENNSDLGGGAKIYGGHYGDAASWDANWKKDKPLMVNEFSSLYYSGPEEPACFGGEGCFADFDIRTKSAGEEARETILGLRALGAASITPWNFVWYGLDPAFPYNTVRLDPDPSSPGIKTQLIGPNSVSLNYNLPSGKSLEPNFRGRWQPNAAFEVMKSGYAPVAAFFREQNNNFYDSRDLVRHIDVYNDVSSTTPLRVEITLGSLAKEVWDLDMGPYEHRVLKAVLKIPRLGKETTLPLYLGVYPRGKDAEKPLHSESIDLWIVPEDHFQTKRQKPGRSLVVIDSTGKTSELLGKMGYKFELVSGEKPNMGGLLEEGSGDVIIIGKDQLPDTTLFEFTSLAKEKGFFFRGCVLIVLEGAFARDVDAPLNQIERNCFRAWRRSAPDFWGFIPGDEMLRYWSQNGSLPYSNGTVARNVFRKPSRGGFIPLAEVADGGDGLDYSPLLWLPLEKGGIFLNGLELVGSAETHPAAAEILCRMIDRGLAGDVFSAFAATAQREKQPGDRTVRVFSENNSKFHFNVERTGVKIGSEGSVIIVDASSRTSLEEARSSGLAEFLKKGGTVFLSQITSDTANLVNEMTGIKISVKPGQWENAAKARGCEMDPVLQGISQDDLVWVRRGTSEAICTFGIESLHQIESLITTVPTQWAGYADAAEQHKYGLMLRRRKAFPGPHIVLGRVKIGEGWLYLSQLRLTDSQYFVPKAGRILTLLLANAGAGFQDSASALLDRRFPYVDESGYIRKWLILGTFGGVEPGKLLARDFAGGENNLKPLEGVEVSGKKWKSHTATEPYLNLNEGFKGEPLENVAGYMAVYVYSPRARDIILDTPDMVDLAIGSDDGVRAWLNGEEILLKNIVRPWAPDQERIRGVKLKKGWNLLVLKISQYSGDWKASARFLTTSGLPVTDLKYSTNPPVTS